MQTHSHRVGDKEYFWNVEKLFPLAAQLPRHRVKINQIPNLNGDLWFQGIGGTPIPSIIGVANHIKRMQKADLSYPIILSKDGRHLVDGGHRVLKAIVEGHDEIEAVYMDLPDPDRVVEHGYGSNK